MIWPCWICRSDQVDCGHREPEIATLQARADDLRRQLKKALVERVWFERRLARMTRKRSRAA